MAREETPSPLIVQEKIIDKMVSRLSTLGAVKKISTRKEYGGGGSQLIFDKAFGKSLLFNFFVKKK